MAVIRLKDLRTGSYDTYPIAYFDYDAFAAHIALNPTDGSVTEGSIITANTGLPASVIGSEDKYYYTHVKSAYLFLSDTVSLGDEKNLLYAPINDTWRSLFAPNLSGAGSSYTVPPASYNTYGEYWRDAAADIDGTHQVTKAPASFDITKTYYSSTKAARVFETVNHMNFGLSMFCGTGYLLNLSALISVGAKQYDRGESPSWNNRYNIDWAPTMTGGIILDNDAGDYRSTVASYEVDSYPTMENACKRITTQAVYTTRSGVNLLGVAAILWEQDTFGNWRPSEFSINFIPLWAWGGISGEFNPIEPPDPDEIPPTAPEWTNGSWTINNSPAGTASIPAVSPLASIGVNDAGLHVFVVKGSAISRITDAAWTASEAKLQALMSGIISCGFIPQKFVDKAIEGKTALSSLQIGTTKVTGLSSNAWLINDRIFIQLLNVASFDLSSRTYGNYLDYEPYTSVMLSVPFCGEISIPASACIGGSISIDMNINMTTGDLVATINCESGRNVTDGLYNYSELRKTYFVRGNCLSKFPITGASNGMSQYFGSALQVVGGIASTAAGIASGNVNGIVGGASAVASGIFDATQARHQPIVNGAPVGDVSLIDKKKVRLTITRPAPVESNELDGYKPYFMNAYGTLSQLTGSVTGVKVLDKWNRVTATDASFEVSGMTRTEQERIAQLLSEGVLI